MSEKNDANTSPELEDTGEVREIPLHSLNMRQLIELDACTRCGECLTWCPVHDQDARETLIPRRKVIDFLRIAKSQQGLLAKIIKKRKVSDPLKRMLGRVFGYRDIGRAEIDDFVQNLYECSTCGQCEVVCPAHIETVTLWEELRRIIVQAGYGPLEAQKGLVKSVKAFDNPWQQPRAGRTKWARKAKKEGLIKQLPPEIKKNKAKVLLFFGCTAAYDVNVRQVAINNVNILQALGVDYGILGSEEKCCASVLLRMGDPEHERVFKQNIDQFNSLGIDTLISSCSGCFKTIMQDYPRIAPLNFEVLHSIEFLARLLKQGKLKFPHAVNRTVTYHDPCHLGRATGGYDAPRMIMEAIPGLKLIEMPRNREYSRCCGAGGGLKAGYPDIQNKMARRRVNEAEETGAEALVSSCPFCYQGLNIGISSLESQLVMRDISALVAESLLGYDVFEQPTAQSAKAPESESKAPQALKTVAKAPAVRKSTAASAERAAKKAAREQKRAARRADRKNKTPRERMPQAVEAAAAENASPPAGGEPSGNAAAKAAKKAEREKRRAARRAATKKESAAESAESQVPGAADSVATESASVPVQAAPSRAAIKQENGSDAKKERMRRRAERRAQRETEKSARRAARRT